MKKLTIAFIVILCIALLVSCSTDKQGDTNTPDVTTTHRGERLDLSQFSIYFAMDTKEKTNAAIEDFAGALSMAYGVQVKLDSDFVMPGEEIPTGTKEILIGKTNRPESASLLSADDSAYDFHIYFDGTRLCVVGETDEATAEGVYHLTSMIEKDGLYMDIGYKYDYVHEFPCKSVKINGTSLTDYTIAFGSSELSRSFAKELIEIIYERTGITLAAKSFSQISEGNIIIADTKQSLGADFISDEYGYSIYVENGDVKIAYTDGNSAYMALCTFREMLSGDVDLADGYRDARGCDVLRVSLLGDSNTAMAYVHHWLDVYLTTRYPDKLIELDNRGVSGDTASGAYERLSWDLYPYDPDIVVVCFGGNGMTEYVGTLTDTKIPESTVRSRMAWYMSNMTKLVEELQSKGKEVIIATSIPYDEWVESKADNYRYVYETFITLVEQLKLYAQDKGIEFVDCYNNLLPITKDYREATGNTSVALMNTDRKHMNLSGAWAAAFAYIEESRWASDGVASVSIEVEEKSAEAKNAEVEVLTALPECVRFRYKPLSLPMPVNEYYEKVNSYGTLPLDEYNDEIIKVTGLLDGEYEISFDGVTVATATSEELASGVDISSIAKNPSQKISKEIFTTLEAKRNNIASVRAFSYIDKNYLIKNGITLGSHEEKLAHYKEQIEKNNVSGYLKSCMESYIKKANEISGYDAKNDACDFRVRVLAHSDSYLVAIIKK